MKTIKQIADELGVSKQTIQKRISRQPLCTRIYPYISTNQGVKYIDKTGENLIKSAFLQKDKTDVSIDVPINKNTDVYSEIIELLKENLIILQNQLIEKDKQIAELTETVKTQAQSINAANHNELAETLQQQFLSDERENKKPKRGIFGILNRKKGN